MPKAHAGAPLAKSPHLSCVAALISWGWGSGGPVITTGQDHSFRNPTLDQYFSTFIPIVPFHTIQLGSSTTANNW